MASPISGGSARNHNPPKIGTPRVNSSAQWFYYDTISHSGEALGYLVGQVGAERVMLGSDYCFDMGCARPVEVVTEHPALSAEDKALILEGNARRLLGL